MFDVGSRYYDGPLYAFLIAPLHDRLREVIAAEVAPGGRVLEACAGTGHLAARLARDAREVVGVELSPAMFRWASSRPRPDNVRYVHGDVTRALAGEADGAFDAATVVLALHEMPVEVRRAALGELARLARRVLVCDFAAPMPWNGRGLVNRAAELAAGPSHFRGYLHWQRSGGLPALAASLGLAQRELRRIDRGTLALSEVTRG